MSKGRKLVVWGLRGYRVECPPAENGSQQTREIVAAVSKAQACRLFKCTLYELNNYGSITGNDEEIALAMSKPGTVFWMPIDGRWKGKNQWRESK